MKRISEYVSIGHPDKTADFISEYLLDRYLEKDPDTRFAVEVQVKDQHVTLGGEVTSKAAFSDGEIAYYVRRAVHEIGYTSDYAKRWEGKCLDATAVSIVQHLSQQSPDIAQGVNQNRGWGDQGIFFGYAEHGSPLMLPKDHQLARTICTRLYDNAKDNPELGWGIDIKTQIVMPEDSDTPEKLIIAIPLKYVEGEATVLQFLDVLKQDGIAIADTVIINGTGRYEAHSSVADCGTTGRKLAVDFYGGNCRIGGGSPWTKDGSKADLALNLFARSLAVEAAHQYQQTVTVSLGSCIGQQKVDYCIYTEQGKALLEGAMTIDPEKVIESLGLKKPHYAEMCRKGLFGSGFNWDKDCDK